MTCPECEYNRQRAQLWRHEAYKLGGHPLDWKPELMVRPKPLTDEEYTALAHRIASKYAHRSDLSYIAYTFLPHTLEQFVRAIEAAHGIKE